MTTTGEPGVPRSARAHHPRRVLQIWRAAARRPCQANQRGRAGGRGPKRWSSILRPPFPSVSHNAAVPKGRRSSPLGCSPPSVRLVSARPWPPRARLGRAPRRRRWPQRRLRVRNWRPTALHAACSTRCPQRRFSPTVPSTSDPPRPPPPPLGPPSPRGAIPLVGPPPARRVNLSPIAGKGIWLTLWPTSPLDVTRLVALARAERLRQLWCAPAAARAASTAPRR